MTVKELEVEAKKLGYRLIKIKEKVSQLPCPVCGKKNTTNDIILETREEAEVVLKRMNEIIEAYGVVSVADLCDLVGVSCNYMDNKYGWTNIRNAEPIGVRGGYMLKLPKALPIK